ncbi:MAG: hypothetical protein IT210_01580 [Armatimonadetes bacterium]|nr:hypothetical protein [Armatimonadota bacterium]
MKKQWFGFGLAFLLLAVIAGCGGGGSGDNGPLPGGRFWTVLVYMDADNDLEEFSILNIRQMERLGSNDNIALVVQVDRRPGFYTDVQNDWTGTRRYYITKDPTDDNIIRSQPLADMGEVDMGNPDRLKEFIQWGANAYPAQHYAVILWNHGAGWRKGHAADPGRGVLYDDTNGTFMTMAQLAAGLNAGMPLDLISFDASLMGMIEVAYEIKDLAPLMVASEESPPGPGYPYDKILAHLFANPQMTATELGGFFVQEHIAAYPNQNVTQSLVSLPKVPALAQAVNGFAALLNARLADPNLKNTFRLQRQNSVSYAYEYYRDLYHFTDLVDQAVTDAPLKTAAQQVKTAYQAAVLAEAHTGSNVASSAGLSIYLPAPGDFITTYNNLRFTADIPEWKRFLQNH